MNPDNAWGTRITAAAGTSLAAPYSSGTVIVSSQRKVFYTPKGVFIHAASLLQPFGHWGRFVTAASRRSLGSVSVPVRRVMLSHPLPVVALVSFYLTNKLIGHRPLSKHRSFKWEWLMSPHYYRVLFPISRGYSRLRGRLPMCYSPVCHVSPKWGIRLACLSHAASVRPEPGSNSQKVFYQVSPGRLFYMDYLHVKLNIKDI